MKIPRYIKACTAFLILIILNFPIGIFTDSSINDVSSKEISMDYDPLDVSIKTGNWLLSQALYDLEGYKWPEYQNYKENRNYTGMNSGSCGIGYFLLELFQQTENSTYLQYAKNAANWLISNGIEETGGIKWEQMENNSNYFTGWSHGAAGIGNYFVKLYHITSNSSYLEIAIKASRDWIFLPRIISIDFKHNLPPICERRCSVAYKYCHP
ncbi:MAG: lanthionine synthetase LanC family protein [Candidatus Helarchaeota archaeon]